MTMGDLCKLCGQPIAANRNRRATYCFGCITARAKTRLAHPARTRGGQLQPLRLDGRWVCLDCKLPVKQDCFSGKLRRPPLRCDPCYGIHRIFTELLSGQRAACAAVAHAKQTGELPPPGTRECMDCGLPAECYDHRDYSQPLTVDPVCFSCNVMRGPARPLNPFLVTALMVAAAAQPAKAGA